MSGGNGRLKTINALARTRAIGWGYLGAHLALLIPLSALTYSFYGGHGLQWPIALLTLAWLIVAIAALAALLAALAPWTIWRDRAIALRGVWIYAAVVAAVAACAMQRSQTLWAPTTRITFELVDRILRPLIPTLVSDEATQVLDTGRFAVQVTYLCSGLEGAGLLLAFCCVWLVYFRREYYFPRALAIIPIGLLVLFILNVLRIALLVLIGHAGYPDVASYGFHSQAGWIAFNCTAGGVAYFSLRSPWFSRMGTVATHATTQNPTAAYLTPFLTILAVGMLSRAASGQFETLYPLRLIAASLALWYCWGKLRTLDFRFTWRGIITGIVVFAIWLGAAHLLAESRPMPAGLAAMPPTWRLIWIAMRIVASVLTVPIAEELAYRGFLMRRVMSADFESVRFGTVGIWALLLSSAVFGVEHGSWWLPGLVAGLLYGLVLVRTGRIGEAIAAHATTNGLIALWVLYLHQWQLW